MADKYDNNGYSGSDFKRNAPQEHKEDEGDDDQQRAAKAGEYMRELLGEKLKFDADKAPITARLIDAEVERVQAVGRVPPKEFRFVDVYREKPVKVTVKVLVPLKEHPKFNFVGKLLGPKGNSLKRLQEETMCKMAILGRGSMKDRQKEEELRNSLDPKYAHLMGDLHVEIMALAPPAEAYARIAFALAEVRKFLVPDINDMIRQEQMRELHEPGEDMRRGGPPHPHYRPPLIPRGGGIPRGMGSGRPPVLATPSYRPNPGGKAKVMSILDRARVSMEDSYGYEDEYEASPVVSSSRHHAPPEEDYYSSSAAYEPPRHPRHRDYYDESPAALSTAVAESYHYPREEYSSVGASSHHHRSYKVSSRGDSTVVGSRRAPSSTRDSRYRSSPYTTHTRSKQ